MAFIFIKKEVRVDRQESEASEEVWNGSERWAGVVPAGLWREEGEAGAASPQPLSAALTGLALSSLWGSPQRGLPSNQMRINFLLLM